MFVDLWCADDIYTRLCRTGVALGNDAKESGRESKGVGMICSLIDDLRSGIKCDLYIAVNCIYHEIGSVFINLRIAEQ